MDSNGQIQHLIVPTIRYDVSALKTNFTSTNGLDEHKDSR
jgi:hypothetical protein